jgi:putative transposase
MFLGKSKWFYDMTGKFLGYKDSSAILTVVKNEEFLWLQEADKFALQNALRDLNKAFVDFFTGKTGYPKRKSKKGRQSYRTNPTNGNIKVLDKAIQLPKLGVVRCVYHRPIDAGANAKLENVTVSRNPTVMLLCVSCYSGVEIENAARGPKAWRSRPRASHICVPVDRRGSRQSMW